MTQGMIPSSPWSDNCSEVPNKHNTTLQIPSTIFIVGIWVLLTSSTSSPIGSCTTNQQQNRMLQFTTSSRMTSRRPTPTERRYPGSSSSPTTPCIVVTQPTPCVPTTGSNCRTSPNSSPSTRWISSCQPTNMTTRETNQPSTT